jgi:hypothetical protein
MATHEPFPRLRATAARAQQRELEARRRVRAMRAEQHAATLEARRATALLEARSRRLEEALEREGELVRELERARAALRESDAKLIAATEAQVAMSRAVAARDERLSDARDRIAHLELERRKLHKRALDLRASRGYRLVRWSWRVRAALRRPWQLLRRG